MKTHLFILISILFTWTGVHSQIWQEVGSSSNIGTRPRIVVDSGTPFVAFVDPSASDKLTVMSYDGSSWNTLGTPGFADEINSLAPMMDVENGTPYVITHNVQSHVIVYTFDGTNWVQLGADVTDAPGWTPTISIENGIVYAGYRSGGTSISVKKYENGIWSLVGTADFSGPTNTFVLKVKDGTPYVFFQDADSLWKGTVMYFDGNSWLILGQSEFTADEISGFIDIEIENGEVFVSYSDQSQNDQMSVMKYDGSSWGYVGSAGFSSTNASRTRISLDNGNLHACYLSSGTSYVEKFDGTMWQEIGSFSGTTFPDISMHGTIPYITYRNGTDNMVYVEKFDFGVGLEEATNSEVFLYPNPSRNYIHIESDTEIAAFTVFDNTGSVILQGIGNYVDVRTLEAGMYHVHIETGEQTKTLQFIKE